MSWCHIYYITSVILYIYSGYVTASEYYVSAAPNGESCPSTDLPCHDLSYYTAYSASYFTDDAIFYFLQGTHTLQGILNISNVSNITLQGMGHIEQGFHETVMQSTSVIMCSDSNRTGIRFSSSGNITIKSLTVATCGFDNYISLQEIPHNPGGFYWYLYHRVSFFFVDINSVTLECISVQNSSGHGLVIVNAFDVLIDNSSFVNNGISGNTLIVNDDQLKRLSRVTILKSHFSLGLGYGMYFWYGNNSEADLIIKNSIFSNNIALSGGGVNISLHGGGSVEFSNCTIYNNTARYGGGMDISTYRNGSIKFSNCTIYNNTAQFGGGMDIYTYGNGSIELSNCTIYNNTSWYDGGGVDISTYGNGSIELSNCTIYNNTAWYGGGMDIYTYGNGSIELSNCTIYNNTAWYDGGGVDISTYGNGSIELSNCTIYNNTALYGGGMDIYIYGNGNIEFSDCTIRSNTAHYGGGGVDLNSYWNGSIEFSNCTIYNNTARYRGGGGVDLNSYGNGSIEFSNCTIYNNTARYRGGGGVDLYLYGNGSIEFSSCTIYNNSARYDGGGVDIYSYGNGSIEFSNCTIYNNAARYRGGGGVDLYLYGNGSIEFSNCTIYNNTARYDIGGVDISTYGKGNIEFSTCTIYNNAARYGGGGVDINSYGDGSTEFSNCTIYNNAARYGEGGGVDLYSYGNGSIEFSSCTIYNNTARYSGGGVELYSYGNGSIEFSNCTIYNNAARYRGGGGVDLYLYGNGSIEFSSCTIYNNSARYDGGGVDIYSYGNGSIEFSNCRISNNTAQYSDGGGVAIYSIRGSVSIEFFNCTLYKNTAQYNGAGLYITLFSDNGNIALINCNIYCNSAQSYGGGVFIYLYTRSSSNKFSNCIISNNSACYASGLYLSYRAISTSTSSFHFTNVLILSNEVINNCYVYQKIYQSAVTLKNINNVTFDQIEVSNHNTTGLVGVNSLITFDRHDMFLNNSGIYGGGIALYESSQLIIKEHTNISFVNNHASVSGGGIFVSKVLDIENTTDCTFKVIPHHDPNDKKTVLYFVNNTADISGDVLYGGKIDDCTSTLYFDHLFYYPQQTGLSVVTSDPIQVCFCESHELNCSIEDISIFAIPGVNVNISLAIVGLKDSLKEGVIKLNLSENSSTLQYANNRLNANCTNIIFKLITNPSLNKTQVYATLNSSIHEPLYDPYAKVIDVTIEPCPNGYPLENDTCVCRSELNSDSITCDNDTLVITRIGDMWIGYENDSNCLIVYPNCPFDYCNKNNVSFILNYHNKQCLHNRDGVLCGQCSKGFSLTLGSNQCGQCTNNYIALIIPFTLAGIAVIAFIIVLNLTVSVGTINGLIFYANVVKLYEHVFFPKGTIPFLSQFISWVNLDLGINTCFYHGMDSCIKAWLQFVFPAYIWFLLILIIISLRYSTKMVRLVGRQIIPVIATMILLSYTKLIHTVVQALYWVEIPCSDDKNNTDSLLRWYFDANVNYLEGCHLLLFLFSLTVLILLIIPYTFYLLTIPLFEGPLSKYMCYFQKLLTNVRPIFDAYGGPYKDKCRFWTGFLLLLRVILALVVSLNTNSTASYDVLASILIIIVFMYFLLKEIYRHFPLDFLEKFFILNLMFMAYMNEETSTNNNDSKRQWSSFVSVLLSFIIFCGIILYHVWDRLMFYNVWDRVFKSNWQQQIIKVKKIFKKPPPPTSNDMELPLMHPKSPDGEKRSISMSVVSVGMKRESILFDQDD